MYKMYNNDTNLISTPPGVELEFYGKTVPYREG